MKEDVTVAQVAHEHRSRIEREEREWLAARIHFAAHGEWSTEGCPACQRDEVELLREGDPAFTGQFR